MDTSYVERYLQQHPDDNDTRQLLRVWNDRPEIRPAPGSRIVELGPLECPFANAFSLAGYDVTGYDLRPAGGGDFQLESTERPYTHIQRDILATWPDLQRGSFASAWTVSAVEHVGLPHYGGLEDPMGDVWAMRRLYEFLEPGSTVWLTVPIGGTSITTPHWRRYTFETLIDRILGPFSVEVLECWWTANQNDNRQATFFEVIGYSGSADISAVMVLRKAA